MDLGFYQFVLLLSANIERKGIILSISDLWSMDYH